MLQLKKFSRRGNVTETLYESDNEIDLERAGCEESCLYPKGEEVKSKAKGKDGRSPLPLLPTLQ